MSTTQYFAVQCEHIKKGCYIRFLSLFWRKHSHRWFTHSFVIGLQLVTRHKSCLQEIYNIFCEIENLSWNRYIITQSDKSLKRKFLVPIGKASASSGWLLLRKWHLWEVDSSWLARQTWERGESRGPGKCQRQERGTTVMKEGMRRDEW